MMRTRLALGTSLATVLLLAGLAPSASACHATAIPDVSVGAVVIGGIPRVATIAFGACEGPVSVTVDVLRGGSDTFTAQLDIVGDTVLGTDCLFEGGCAPFYPPVAAFTLSSVDRDMLLVGTFENVGHYSAIFTLAGTYLDAPAAFQIVIA